MEQKCRHTGREESDGMIFGVDVLCRVTWSFPTFLRSPVEAEETYYSSIHSLIHSFIISFLLTSYCVLGFVLVIVDTMVRKTDKVSALMGLTTELGKN